MPFLPLFLGTATTAGVVALVVAVAAVTGYYIHSWSIFFIFPVGGIAAGLGCGVGVFRALIFSGKRPRAMHYLLSAGLALAGFVGIYFALYETTYVETDGRVNHWFQGQHISNFAYKDTGSKVNFRDYLLRDIVNRESTFFVGSRRIHVPVGTFHMPSVYNWAHFGLEAMGFLVGGLMVGSLLVGDRRYCERCQRYMKDKLLFNILPDQFDDKLQRLNVALRSAHDLRALIETESATKAEEGHVQTTISYCPMCYEGFLLLKAMRKTTDGFEELKELRQTIRVSGDIAREVTAPLVPGR